MKIARYKSIKYGAISVDAVEPWLEEHEDYIRLTEPVEVEFTDLPPDETVPKEVAALESAKEVAHAAYLTLAAELDEKIAKLLAITHEVTE